MPLTWEDIDRHENTGLRDVLFKRLVECPVCESMKPRRKFCYNRRACFDCIERLGKLGTEGEGNG